ncbi:carotenoid 1,2-hydratase [Chlorobaculum sp. 24CR]|uniref:carotenoid 1,2-hydratase n=1 Tax=Chlorobaculum sp. 24CR TaxID=2508878 RepID=UPI00100A974A|nr:carotenoid 1,2-hydratase [Chlorobaculum sp. 24CR]RXK88651.1 carotenoid 1,2-hydratase [Chlorobaculum sp. 24CR]
MNITTDPLQEAWHRLDAPGSYEWWYFDAEDEAQGISVVFIWFAGFAFSPYYLSHYEDWKARRRADPPNPVDYAGFSFQFYENGKEAINFIKEGGRELFASEDGGVGVRFEGNRFVYDRQRDEYRLSIDFSFPARDRSVHASFSFRPQHRFDYHLDTSLHDSLDFRHQWVLSVPKAEVLGILDIRSLATGKRKVVQFRGRGYHDHNLGTVPMYESIDRWYWGRTFSERYDLIYYVVFLRGRLSSPQAVMMLRDHQSGKAPVFEAVSVTESRFTRGLFAPVHGKKLRLETVGVSVEIRHQKALDAGPFYLRYTSRLSMTIGDERLEEVKGISEFLNPAPLRSKLMQFFTASRVLRAGKRSAMYFLYNFFKRQFDWFNKKKF